MMKILFTVIQMIGSVALASLSDGIHGAIVPTLERPEIQVMGEVEISNLSRITLGDISEFDNVPSSLLREVSEVELNFEMEIEAAKLSQIIKEKVLPLFKEKGLSPIIRLPNTVQIKMSSGLSRAHMQRKIKQYVQEKHSEARVDVQLHSVPVITSHDYIVDWGQIQNGSFILPIKEQNSYNPKYMSGQVRIKKLVPVALRHVSSNERIQPEDFRLEYTDVTFSKEVVPQNSELVGQSVSRSISPGQVIWYSAIKREPAAKRGQVVRATVGSEEFEINLNVHVQENGFIGDTIRVKSVETQKEMSAVVTGKDTVRIQ